MNIQLIGSKFPCFIFNRSVITQRIIIALFSSYSLPLSLLLNDRGRQITKQLLLGQYLLNRKRGKEEGGKKDKRGEVIKEKFVALASRCCAHTSESEGDCRRHAVYERSKGFLALLLHTSNTINNAFSLPYLPSTVARTRTHARTHTWNGPQQRLAFDCTVG